MQNNTMTHNNDTPIEKRPYAAPRLVTLQLEATEGGTRFTGQPEDANYSPS